MPSDNFVGRWGDYSVPVAPLVQRTIFMIIGPEISGVSLSSWVSPRRGRGDRFHRDLEILVFIEFERESEGVLNISHCAQNQMRRYSDGGLEKDSQLVY